jgi:hypothetical protein
MATYFGAYAVRRVARERFWKFLIAVASGAVLATLIFSRPSAEEVFPTAHRSTTVRHLRADSTTSTTDFLHQEDTTCVGPCVGECLRHSPRLSVSDVWNRARHFSMLSDERLRANIAAVTYVTIAGLRGDIVEAGVARGGSAAMMGLTAARLGVPRRLHLYDTFKGMPRANEAVDGVKALDWTGAISHSDTSVRALLEGVCGLSNASLVYHVGLVSDTLANSLPPCEIAVLVGVSEESLRRFGSILHIMRLLPAASRHGLVREPRAATPVTV